ncbi:MAG: hypothetical protein ACK46S_07575 [Bacteroidota bacterium]|jgi:hypothetical protein
MKHKGKIVEKAVRESGISITKICKKLGKTTRWMYYTFENPDVPLDHIFQIGKVINHDFSGDLTEINTFFERKMNTPSFSPQVTFFKLEKNADYWKDKYLDLLEKYNTLLTEKLEGKS